MIFAQRFPPSVGGTPSAVRYLVSALPKDRCAVVSLGEPGAAEVWEAGFPQVRLSWPGKLLRKLDPALLCLVPRVLWQASRLLPRRDVAALFVNFPGTAFILAGWLLAKWWRVPLFIYFHDVFKEHRIYRYERFLTALAEPRICRDAVKVYCVSEALRDFYAAKYPHACCAVLPHCTHPAFVAGADLAPGRQWRRTPEEKLVVFTGQVYQSGADALRCLLAAVEHLADVPVRVIVSTPDPPHRLATYGIAPRDRVEILRLDHHEEVITLQRQADILYNPVSFDHADTIQVRTLFPLKTTEYLQVGRPMLVHGAAETAFVQYARRQGFAVVVDRKDPQVLADTIRQMLSQPESAACQAARAAELARRQPARVAAGLLADLGWAAPPAPPAEP